MVVGHEGILVAMISLEHEYHDRAELVIVRGNIPHDPYLGAGDNIAVQ
jgi:hypothetical protein